MPTDQKVTGLSPVGVTKKINHLQRCRWFFILWRVHNLDTTSEILHRGESLSEQGNHNFYYLCLVSIFQRGTAVG